MKNKIKQVSELLVEYLSNMINTSDVAEKLSITEEKLEQILKDTQQDWEDADCDKEGATKEQEAKMDLILERAAEKIIRLKQEQNQ